MFSFFKRPAAKQELTFKARVTNFWKWYAEVAPRFYQTIEAKKCPSLAGEVSAKIDEMLPSFAWVFGPGENGKGHSFTLTGEGVLHRQLLTMFWHSQAPTLTGWTFYPARQPGSIENVRLEIAGKAFSPIEFWITAKPAPDRQKVDLVAWHPLFEAMPEKNRYSVLFLFLDEVLGEFGTEQWIGEIKLNDQKLADAMPLQELNPFLKKLESETGWKKLPPGESSTLYQMKQPHQRFLRGDVIVGTTMHSRLIQEYLEAEGELADPLAGTGADYVFISIDANFLPAGKQTDARGIIEDALAEALKRDSNGRLLGGALGTQNAYIDLLLFDGQTSIETVRKVLSDQKLPEGTSINYFAKEKRGYRIVL